MIEPLKTDNFQEFLWGAPKLAKPSTTNLVVGEASIDFRIKILLLSTIILFFINSAYASPVISVRAGQSLRFISNQIVACSKQARCVVTLGNKSINHRKSKNGISIKIPKNQTGSKKIKIQGLRNWKAQYTLKISPNWNGHVQSALKTGKAGEMMRIPTYLINSENVRKTEIRLNKKLCSTSQKDNDFLLAIPSEIPPGNTRLSVVQKFRSVSVELLESRFTILPSTADTLTINVDPLDAKILTQNKADGSIFSVYGEKDSNGKATSVSTLTAEYPNGNKTEMRFYEGRPQAMFLEDGTIINYRYDNGTVYADMFKDDGDLTSYLIGTYDTAKENAASAKASVSQPTQHVQIHPYDCDSNPSLRRLSTVSVCYGEKDIPAYKARCEPVQSRTIPMNHDIHLANRKEIQKNLEDTAKNWRLYCDDITSILQMPCQIFQYWTIYGAMPYLPEATCVVLGIFNPPVGIFCLRATSFLSIYCAGPVLPPGADGFEPPGFGPGLVDLVCNQIANIIFGDGGADSYDIWVEASYSTSIPHMFQKVITNKITTDPVNNDLFVFSVAPNKRYDGYACDAPPTPTPIPVDECPSDPQKTTPGVCGCGIPDTDTEPGGLKDCEFVMVQFAMAGIGSNGILPRVVEYDPSGNIVGSKYYSSLQDSESGYGGAINGLFFDKTTLSAKFNTLVFKPGYRYLFELYLDPINPGDPGGPIASLYQINVRAGTTSSGYSSNSQQTTNHTTAGCYVTVPASRSQTWNICCAENYYTVCN